MARKRNAGSNLILFASVLIYALVTFPLKQTLFIALFGLTSSLILRDQKDNTSKLFAALAKVITRLRPRPQTPLRAQIVRFCAAIEHYGDYMDSVLTRKKRLFFMLSRAQQSSASATYRRLKRVEELSGRNADFLAEVREFAKRKFDISPAEIAAVGSSVGGGSCVDLLEHFVRDWSPSSAESRTELFRPILEVCTSLQPGTRVLLPGSGLGRLGVEIARANAGIEVSCLELAPEMWIGAQYACSGSASGSASADTAIFPQLTYFSHWRRGADQLEECAIERTAKPANVEFTHGDFLALDDNFGAIVTLFFIDTAQNVFDYIDQIHRLLPRGGVWCNYGPLKWGTAAYAELSGDEMLAYLEKSGRWRVRTVWDDGSNRYNGSEQSMVVSRYRLLGWVAEKL